MLEHTHYKQITLWYTDLNRHFIPNLSNLHVFLNRQAILPHLEWLIYVEKMKENLFNEW